MSFSCVGVVCDPLHLYSLDTVLLNSLLVDVTVEIDREVLSTLCILVDPNSNILTRAFEGTIAFLVYGDPSLLPT
jgi:hypothetical protein